MTTAQFKKDALKLGVKVYSVRKYSNKDGEGYTVTYAYVLSKNAVSTQKVANYHELTLEEILLRFS